MPVWLWCLLIILLLLCAVLFTPVCFWVRYHTGEDLRARLRWTFFVFRFPLEKPKKKMATKPAKQKPAPKKTSAMPEELSELLPKLLKAIPKPLQILLRGFYFTKIGLDVLVAEEDAAETAIAFGKVNALVYGLYALARKNLRMKEPKIRIAPCFTREHGEVTLEAKAIFFPVTGLRALFRFGIQMLLLGKKDARQTSIESTDGQQVQPLEKAQKPADRQEKQE